MNKASSADKELIIDILFKSFRENKSIHFLLGKNATRPELIRKLMAYSVDYCTLFGEVYLSEDRKACALLLFPEKKKTTIHSILLDLRLAISVIGITHLKKTLDREARIKKIHPSTPFIYLWFIGVDPAEQGKGIGTRLLKKILEEALQKGRPVYLETSTKKNIPWYESHGFTIYASLNFGYELYCMKKGA
ncbi:GNAT family N-acetyltransferase [Flavihumibacter sp. UBA7668]|uniref:GNAT family N-acetyltransferase n=1 Tax=Flavihumibacter sp. UBA7668 TaxID=1946542 RepID=UPI0025C411FB|nr:GNAT family N-acetyltransferase [Flavihumibacter sp. UBA7668]